MILEARSRLSGVKFLDISDLVPLNALTHLDHGLGLLRGRRTAVGCLSRLNHVR